MLTPTLTPAAAPPARSPWTHVYGLARSLMAFGLLLTLTFTPLDALFDVARLEQHAVRGGVVLHANFFVVLRDHPVLAQLLAIAILLAVVSGWRPRWTALPHWWVAVSFAAVSRAPDGGDHIHIVLATLLVGVALTDPRRWHWQSPPPPSTSLAGQAAAFVAASCLVMAALQMAVIYFHASVGKMGVNEWANGTAVYYWFTDPLMGAPSWLRPWLDPILASPVGVMVLTWGTLALELGLAIAALLDRRHRRWILLAGLGFHLSIVVIHGLVSFFFSMAAGLILLLRRSDEPFGFLTSSPSYPDHPRCRP